MSFVLAVKITSGDGRFSTVGEPDLNGLTAYGRLAKIQLPSITFLGFHLGCKDGPFGPSLRGNKLISKP